MATYNKWGLSSGNVTNGIFNIYSKINFTQHNMAANDIFQLAKLKQHWILLGSWYRMPGTASTSTATADIGTTKNGSGQEVAAAVDLDSIGNAIWNEGTILPDAPEIVDADSYLTLECLGAAAVDGVLEIQLMIFAGVADSSPCDMDIS